MAFTERNQKRWQLVSYLRVFDYTNNELIGHLFDVTNEGIRLISDHPVTAGKQYQLKMDLPGEGDVSESLVLNAKSIWSKEDINPNFWDSGFQLLEVSRETKSRIDALIAELKATQ